MAKYGSKEIFSANGTIGKVETSDNGTVRTRHTFIPSSQRYLWDCLNRIPVGNKVSVTFFGHKATRSSSQLAYHHVLVEYIAKHAGYTHEEMHDAIMRLKFGTKTLEILGKKVEVRKSISEKARMTKSDAVELIDFDLKICAELGINVPTASELGYQS